MKNSFILLFLLFVVSCDKKPSSYNNLGVQRTVIESTMADAPSTIALDDITELEEIEAVKEDVFPKKQNQPALERKLVKNGYLSFKVDSIDITKKKIEQLVKHYKGYVSSENSNKNTHRIHQYLTIRIPIDNFDTFLDDLSKGIQEFDRKEINVSDVTERYYDITSRLTTKKGLEKRYLQILAKAKNVKEILEVERNLGTLREDIEAMEGRLRLLNNQISLSTFSIAFYQEIDVFVKKPNQFVRSFLEGIDAIKYFALFLVSIWPFVILIWLSFFLIRRKMKRKTS